MIRVLAGIVGVPEKGETLAAQFERGLDDIRASAATLPRRPKVFFEEWYDPLISGIRWTEELVEIAGGDPIFPELANAGLAKDRIVSSDQVIERAPDLIIGSWCGKPVRKERIASQAGMAGRAGRQERPHLRSEIHLHPAAGAGGIDRGRDPVARHHPARHGYNVEMTRFAFALALIVLVAACRPAHGPGRRAGAVRHRVGGRQWPRDFAR